jgi:DNA-binding protein Alba
LSKGDNEVLEDRGDKEKVFTVKVGQKKVWAYVTACVTYFNRGGRRLMIRARGESIPTAVDTANALKRSFYKNLVIEGTSLVEDQVGDERGVRIVSAIEISLSLEPGPKEEM